MGVCCSQQVSLRNHTMIDEFENFKETFLGFPEEQIKTSEIDNLKFSFQKTLSLSVLYLFYLRFQQLGKILQSDITNFLGRIIVENKL